MPRSKTLLLVAGEASGDLHAAHLARAIRRLDPTVRIQAVGGAQLEAAGAEILFGIGDLSVVGITEVVRRLPRLLSVLSALKGRLRSGEIDLFIPVDFPDFNFRLAPVAGRAGVPVLYFIAPQVWAWRTGRLRQMAGWCRHVAVLFPFEVEIFRRWGIPVTHIGHPLVSDLRVTRRRSALRDELGVGTDDRLVALLPGSRSSEIHRHLDVMLEAARTIRWTAGRIRVAIGRAPTLSEAALRRPGSDAAIVAPPAFDLASASDLVLCASGTATVEVALSGTPMIVMYRLSPLTWALARRMVRIPHVAMVNLVAGERLVPELLQEEATPQRLADEAAAILGDPARQDAMRAGYARVREALSGGAGIDAIAALALDLAGGRPHA